jgi:hypothetical protein
MPLVGDLIFVDHEFVAEDGNTRYEAVCQNADGSLCWIADLHRGELEFLAKRSAADGRPA